MGKKLHGWTIIEHCYKPSRIQGEVTYTAFDGSGAFVVGWQQEDGESRRTAFEEEKWNCAVFFDGIVISLKGVAELSLKKEDIILYTLMPPSCQAVA